MAKATEARPSDDAGRTSALAGHFRHGVRMTDSENLTGWSTSRLLRSYVAILEELLRRGVIRTRNAPAGDLAEHVVALAYRGDLAPNSEKSWDVRADDGRLLQVKSRVIFPGVRKSQVFSPFRSFEFDACVFVLFDGRNYEITQAIELPRDSVMDMARRSEWVAGSRVRVFANLIAAPGARDVTEAVSRALASL